MATHTTLTALFTAIANSIRRKTGETGKLVADDFPAMIDALGSEGLPAQRMAVIPIALDSALGNGANSNHTLLSGHDFVKNHYADEGFTALWLPVTHAASASEAEVIGPGFHANRPVFTTNTAYYGTFMRSSGTTGAPARLVITVPLNGTGYNVSFRADSAGNLKLYVSSTYTVPPGDYLLVLLVAA